jgi:hypothetical protein
MLLKLGNETNCIIAQWDHNVRMIGICLFKLKNTRTKLSQLCVENINFTSPILLG